MGNCSKEFDPNVLFTFCVNQVYILKLLQQNKCTNCVSSLMFLPPRNFAVFDCQVLIEYYTQRDKNFTNFQVSEAL